MIMILLKAPNRLIVVNEIKVLRRLVDGGQENLIPLYDVVLVVSQGLPVCSLKSFDSYKQACKYLKCITWEITKCSGNYVFYVEDYSG